MSKTFNPAKLPIAHRPAPVASRAALVLPTTACADSPRAILADIGRHRAALGAFEDACRRADGVLADSEGRDVTEADLAAHEAADAAECAAMDAVFALPIRTPSDLRALADWAAELHGDGSPDVAGRLLDAMRNSSLLAA